MTGQSAQEIQEQVRQVQQHALAPTVSQQPLSPMVAGSGYAPPPVPPLPPMPSLNASSPGGASPKGTIVNMGKISLLSICFSLVFFGASSFLGGFLLGMWFGGPEPISSASNVRKETRFLDKLPAEQHVPIPQAAPTSSQELTTPWFAEQAGSATQDAIRNATIRGVPNFLAPLVTATQSAVGKQMGYKVQQQIQGRSNQPTSSPAQPQPLTTPNTETQLPHHQPKASQPPTSESPHVPIVNPQEKYPHTPLSSENASQSPSKDEAYTIQLGVYAAADNAYALVNQLQTLNRTSHVVEGKSSDGTILYYVHSGLYNDYNAALDTASQFAAQNIPGATIVRVSRNDKGTS